jgi:hypothetical protein
MKAMFYDLKAKEKVELEVIGKKDMSKTTVKVLL